MAHVSYLRCKKHTRKQQSQIKLNRRREILRCFTPCNISVSHALNTYYFAKRHKNIITIIIIIIINKFAKRNVCLLPIQKAAEAQCMLSINCICNVIKIIIKFKSVSAVEMYC